MKIFETSTKRGWMLRTFDHRFEPRCLGKLGAQNKYWRHSSIKRESEEEGEPHGVFMTVWCALFKSWIFKSEHASPNVPFNGEQQKTARFCQAYWNVALNDAWEVALLVPRWVGMKWCSKVKASRPLFEEPYMEHYGSATWYNILFH